MAPGFLRTAGEIALAGCAAHDLGEGVAVQGPGGLIRSRVDRAFLAVGDGIDARRADAEVHQIVPNNRRPALTEGKVVFARAALVGVAGNEDADVWIVLQPGCLTLQDLLVVSVQTVLVEVEVNTVADIHLEVFDGASGRAGVDNATRRFDFGFLHHTVGIGIGVSNRRRVVHRLLFWLAGTSGSAQDEGE